MKTENLLKLKQQDRIEYLLRENAIDNDVMYSIHTFNFAIFFSILFFIIYLITKIFFAEIISILFLIITFITLIIHWVVTFKAIKETKQLKKEFFNTETKAVK